MRNSILFPHEYKKIGWFLLVPSLILGILYLTGIINFDSLDGLKTFIFWKQGFGKENYFFDLVENNPADEVISLLCIIGGLFVAFAKEKTEDEFISGLRLESLVWATYANYLILALCILLLSGLIFLNVMVINMFSLLLLFIIRFNYRLYKIRKGSGNEE